MAFTTPVSKSSPARGQGLLHRLVRCVAVCILLCVTPLSHAEEFPISGVHVVERDGVYLLDADIDFAFSEVALEALSNGVPLTVQFTIEIERVRNWWLDQEVATLEQRYTLQYHALSHQYLLGNLNSGALYSYPRYQAAVQALGRLRAFPLLDSKLILADEEYELSMRAELDIEALPSPLRIVAYITPEWRLSSDWYTWPLKP